MTDRTPRALKLRDAKPPAVTQSFDLKRVLEGEKAQRSEAARRLREVEKRLAVAKSPDLMLSSPLAGGAGPAVGLDAEKAELEEQIRRHSMQVGNTRRAPGRLAVLVTDGWIDR
jgi:hypothetical protein